MTEVSMNTDTSSYLEDHVSQIPALQVLMSMGYEYLGPDEAVHLRGGKTNGVLLDGILEEQLRKLNVIRYKGQDYAFSEGNIQAAVQALKDILFDGLVRTNEKAFDLLTLGKSLQQTIQGDTKSFPLRYIDWERPENNVWHATAEFAVDRPGTTDTRRPDIVLFINGIPLVVIECKSPAILGTEKPVDQAVSQMIRNQKEEGGIPKLFIYSQVVLAVGMNEAKYATTGTAAKFWAGWKEQVSADTDLTKLIATSMTAEQKAKLFVDPFRYARDHFDTAEAAGPRGVTEQDRALYALCRPERLLELTLRYTLFDGGEKKIARYQQYFTIKEILKRIHQRDAQGRRKGGVVWHTQGSGKSLTMVMLAESIAMEADVADYKIVLVTDRVDLDDQIYKTFAHCGAEVQQARTGAHLAELIEGNKKRIITTIIDKFEAALARQSVKNEDPNVFVLVDEGHRGQYGPMHAKMKKVLPNACFIGFTGTPVIKKEKNTVNTFGGLITPTYTIEQAVEDKAVVPLLYEGRHVEQTVNAGSVDAWFSRITEGLTKEQAADLKRKFASTDQLNKAEQKVMRIAYDISDHFRKTWKGTPFKAQLVAQDKNTALLYKKHLDEFGMVTSQVLFSGPDEREGEEDIYEDNTHAVQRFWTKMMQKYGTEKEYNKQIIDAFKYTDEPEIIIVVDKLLTGFDAPRNTVLYLTRMLKDHSLLQAIARVNRLHDGKEFGYIIDYRGVLGNLDTALALYSSLAEFDEKDLQGTLVDVAEHVRTLPQKHSDLLDVFKGVRNRSDVEEYERLLAENALREDFYKRLSSFARTLAIALSSVKFIEDTPNAKVERYKNDLKFFMKLRMSVRRRYAEEIDFGEYEGKIQKLIDTHVGTGEVETITPLVNIFDKDAFKREVEEATGKASKADTIAYRTKKTISERMAEDPAFYKRFSEMLEDAIRAFRQQRISDADYLQRVSEISDSVRDRSGDHLPSELRPYEVAKAFYGVVLESVAQALGDQERAKKVSTDAAIRIDEIISRHRIVNWATNPDVQNRMKTEIEDLLFDLKKTNGLSLAFDDIDRIMEQCIDIARIRYAS
jgi:type I restriction enzyme R subunit